MTVKYNHDKLISKVEKWVVKRLGDYVKEEEIMVYLQFYLKEKHRPYKSFSYSNKKDFINVEYL